MTRGKLSSMKTGALILALALLAVVGVIMPSSARADVWWSVSLTAEVLDGHGAPAQGVPVAYSFSDLTSPDSGVIVTGADGTAWRSHAGFEDNGYGFDGGYSLQLDDPYGAYSLARTESDGFWGDPDNVWLHTTYYLADAGVISGVVRDASGLPLAGVGIELYVSALDSSLERVVRITSDQVGRYRFAGLGSRTYAVRFAYGSPYGPRFWGGTADPATAASIALGPDEARLDIDGEPGPLLTSSVAGRVTTGSGSGVRGVVVRTWRVTDDGSLVELPGPAVTDEWGAYLVKDLAAGTYTVSVDLGRRFGGVRWLGGVRDRERASFVTVGWGDHVDGLDFVLPRGILRGPRRAAR